MGIINRRKKLKFMGEVFFKLESDLEVTLNNLQTIKPLLSIQPCPTGYLKGDPIIFLKFIPKEMEKEKLVNDPREKKYSTKKETYYTIKHFLLALSENQKRELEINELVISGITNEIAKKHDLKATRWTISTQDGSGEGLKEFYTFKPRTTEDDYKRPILLNENNLPISINSYKIVER